MCSSDLDLTKRGLKLGVVVADKVSEAGKSVAHNVAEIGESFNDLVAEARADLAQERATKASKNGTAVDTVTEVTIEG